MTKNILLYNMKKQNLFFHNILRIFKSHTPSFWVPGERKVCEVTLPQEPYLWCISPIVTLHLPLKLNQVSEVSEGLHCPSRFNQNEQLNKKSKDIAEALKDGEVEDNPQLASLKTQPDSISSTAFRRALFSELLFK